VSFLGRRPVNARSRRQCGDTIFSAAGWFFDEIGVATEGRVSKTPAKDGSDKRRSTRLTFSLPVKVRGFDALQEPFAELTRTITVSCHGCSYLSRNYVPKGSSVTLEIPHGDPQQPPREATARVVFIQRPKRAHEMLHIGLNLDVPGNVWDIPMPPDDWFPLPGEEMFVLEELPAPVTPAAPPPAPVTLTASWDASEILVMASRAEGREAELTTALQLAQTETAVAVEKEAISSRPQIIHHKAGMDLQERMEEALKASIERLSESAVQKIVERASQHMAQIVEEARKAYQAATEELEERIRRAVHEAWISENGNRHGRGRRQR
jgi:hypothetical protein